MAAAPPSTSGTPGSGGSSANNPGTDLYQSGPSTSGQFIRKWQLTLLGNGQEFTLSDSNASGAQSGGTAGPIADPLRITFKTRQITVGSRGTLDVTIYNLARKAHPLQGLRQLYTRIILSAGYQTGRYGKIFDGTIIDWRQGKTPDFTHTYLTITAGDGDFPYNVATTNMSRAKGTKVTDVVTSIAGDMAAAGATLAKTVNLPVTPLIRGIVNYGMSKELFRKFGLETFIQNQQMVVYKPGTDFSVGSPFTYNAKTGLVGMVESHGADGIQFDCLLNPDLQMYGTVIIDESDINQASGTQSDIAGVTTTFGPANTQIGYEVDPSQDGQYKIIAVEHRGDTRGNPWYSHVTCWPTNAQLPPNSSLIGYGIDPSKIQISTNTETPNVPTDNDSGYYQSSPGQVF